MKVSPATRIHKLTEIVDAGDLPTVAHHYVISDDLLRAMAREDVQRSIASLIEAGMARLPFSSILVEFSAMPGTSRFVFLEEAPDHISAMTSFMSEKVTTTPTLPAFVKIKNGALGIDGAASEADALAIVMGTAFAMLMLNIQGIEKVHIATAALNKARAQLGKPIIPTHTLLRIGTVFDRLGNPVKGPAALLTVYMRAGHARNQACGKDWSERKLIYIYPVLVNYRDGDEEPEPRLRVVKM